MKIFMSIGFAALVGVIAVYAKTLENEEELMEEIKQLLDIDSLQHQQATGHHVARSLETRGKKNKNKTKKPKNKKKKPGKADTGDDETGNGTGDNGGNPVKLPNGVTEHPSVTVHQGGKSKTVTVEETALHCHNVIRAIYGVPALKWDSALAKSAQKHADDLAAAGKLFHTKGNYGENVGYHSISIEGTVYTPAFTCFDWWVECQNPGYNYDKPGYASGTGHFTQVVWKGSEKVGCAEASIYNKQTKMANTYLVCQYYPPGNYIGQFEANVPKPKKALPKAAKDIAKEGCCDYCPNGACKNYASSCSKYDFLREACCDTCK